MTVIASGLDIDDVRKVALEFLRVSPQIVVPQLSRLLPHDPRSVRDIVADDEVAQVGEHSSLSPGALLGVKRR